MLVTVGASGLGSLFPPLPLLVQPTANAAMQKTVIAARIPATSFFNFMVKNSFYEYFTPVLGE